MESGQIHPVVVKMKGKSAALLNGLFGESAESDLSLCRQLRAKKKPTT